MGGRTVRELATERGPKLKTHYCFWGALWRSENALVGVTEYLLLEGPGNPMLFVTRKATREWITAKYGYICQRSDLRAEPHGWQMPRAVRVELRVVESKKGGAR
jgi:hypothetical protein